MSSGLILQFGYRLIAPPLFLPWIITQFVAASIAWLFLALWALWAWNVTLYYIPLGSLAVFVFTSPVQVNQRIVIGIFERIAEYFDTLIDDIVFPIVEHFIYFISPACWSFNFLWNAAIALFRIGIWNPVKVGLMQVFPNNPFAVFQDPVLQVAGFPISVTVNTSSSPGWIVGPYDRQSPAARQLEHLLDGTRTLDPMNPAVQGLMRWLRKRGKHAGPHTVRLNVLAHELDTWTHPGTPDYERRSLTEQIVRRTIDRELGLEQPGWWELEPDQVPEPWTAHAPPQWITKSPWAKVFGLSLDHIDWDGIGVVELDEVPELPQYARARGLKPFPGSKAYRYLANDKGDRNLAVDIFEAAATVVSIIFDTVARVFLEILRLLFRIAVFLFSNMVDFFENTLDFFAALFTRLARELLNLPCLQFGSFADFAISMLDCICTPIRDVTRLLGAWTENYWNFSRPSSASGLPQAIMQCLGLGCMDINLILSQGPAHFISQLLGSCLMVPDEGVCCALNPLRCLPNAILFALPCNCPNTGFSSPRISAPACNWANNIGNIPKCVAQTILIILNCENNDNICTGSTSLADLFNQIVNCIVNFLLDSSSFINAIVDEVSSKIGFPRRRSFDRFTVVLNDDERDYSYGDDIPTTSTTSTTRATPKTVTITSVRNSSAHSDLIARAMDVAADDDATFYGAGYGVVDVARKMDRHRRENMMGIDDDEVLMQLFEARLRHQEGRDPADPDPESLSTSMWGAVLPEGSTAKTAFANAASALRKDSPTRIRARVRAQMDRKIFNNPYIRIATSRFVQVLRGILDASEEYHYGPDPFVRRAADAEPLKPDDIRNRYGDQTLHKQEAYMMHAQAVAENPYYAGLYKVLFEIGAAEELGREDSPYDEALEAMTIHANDPMFHMGRMMSASRQIYTSLWYTLNEVWWDSDSFSFHFPLYPQIHEIMVRSHVPTFCDDMRSATMDWVRTASADIEDEMHHDTMRFIEEEEEQDMEMAAANHPIEVAWYSWFVEAEIAVRSAAIRLLSPRHLIPMLEEVATHSPIHAHYAFRMAERVNAMREASPHYRKTFENDIDMMLEKYIEEEREAMAKESAERVAAGYMAMNQLTMRLDPDFHPDLGNRSLSVGERVRFEDGRTGVFLGTQATLTRSIIERSSGTRSMFGGGGSNVGDLAIQPRAWMVAVFKGVVKVFQFVWKYRRWFITGIVALITTPWGRVIWESWFHFAWLRVVRPLYTEGLDEIFGSVQRIVDLIVDFQILNGAILFFLINEIFRYVLCYAWLLLMLGIAYPFLVMINIISFGIVMPLTKPIIVIFLAFYLVFPNCPPEQVIENSRMTQSPFQYFDDLIKCFGKVDLNEIPDHFGKGSYNGVCTTKKDCPGNAPCVCEDKGGQMSSIFIEFVDDTPCGTVQAPTGQCLCWPKFNCEFRFLRLDTQRFFDVDCRDYGYNIDAIVWYQTSSWFRIAWNAHNNFWVSMRYITRTITRAPGIPGLLFPVLISAGVIVFFWVQYYAGGIIIGLTMVWAYVLPMWRRFTIDVTLPALRIVINTGVPPFNILADWIAGFFRFPNHTVGTPLGHMRSGEGVCFIFNTGTLFGGASVTFFFWGFVILVLWYGFGPIFWLLYNLFMTPVRMIYAPVWFYLQQSGGQEKVEAVKDRIRRTVPGAARAMDIGGKVWAYSEPVLRDMVPRQPDTYLNRWVSAQVPRISKAFGQYHDGPPRPVIVRAHPVGMGGGTLDHDLFLGQQPIAGSHYGAPLTGDDQPVRRPHLRRRNEATITELPDDYKEPLKHHRDRKDH